MEKKDPRYQAYLHILQEELIPALGCTEPIALAYAAAAARKALGQLPRRIHAGVSGSILKNVKLNQSYILKKKQDLFHILY